MRFKGDLIWFLRNYLKTYRGELVVSRTRIGCKKGEVKVYIKHKRGKLGSLWKSPCIPTEEAEELMQELRKIIKNSKLGVV